MWQTPELRSTLLLTLIVGHLRDQLAGRAAAAGEDHVRRRRRRLQLDDDRHGRGRARRRTVRGEPAQAARATCCSSRGWRSAWRSASAALAPTLGIFIVLARARRRRADRVPRHVQLADATAVRPGDARPGHGRVHDRPARQHADRRAHRRLDQRAVRAALGPGGRRHRHHHRGRRVRHRVRRAPAGATPTSWSRSDATRSCSASTARSIPASSAEP